jgi:hypothetical protein
MHASLKPLSGSDFARGRVQIRIYYATLDDSRPCARCGPGGAALASAPAPSTPSADGRPTQAAGTARLQVVRTCGAAGVRVHPRARVRAGTHVCVCACMHV